MAAGAAGLDPPATGSRLLRFAAVGATGVAVNLAGLWLLAGVLNLREVLASAIAIEASITWNFLLNNAFTYGDRNARAQARPWERLVRYNLVSLVGLAIQLGAFVLVRAVTLHLTSRETLGALRYPIQCVGIVLATGWNFAGNLHFTWRQSSPGRSAANGAGEGAA